MLRITQRQHTQDEIKSCQNDMRKSWRIIKEVINKNLKKSTKLPKIRINGNLCEDPRRIAETFNNFFTNIGPILDQKIPKNNLGPLHFIPGNYTVNIFLTPTSETEVNKIIDNLKNCAVGWDHLPAIIFKDNKTLLSNILKRIVNLSLEQGTFPTN